MKASDQVPVLGYASTPTEPDDVHGDAVLETHRAMILIHGFLHAAVAIPMGVLWWKAAVGYAAFLLIAAAILIGGFELYLSAYGGARARLLTRIAVSIYAVLALVAFAGLHVPVLKLSGPTALWLSILTYGSGIREPSLAVGVQGLTAACAIVLALAMGRRTLIVSSPAWLLAWLLAHGIRSIVGAAYYLTYDLGAEPLWRRIENRPRPHVVALVLGGPPLAAIGGLLAYGLVLACHRLVPPIFRPLMYVAAIDLILLPLLPLAALAVLELFRRVASRGEVWVYVLSPVFVALAPAAALVLLWLAVHRMLVQLARGVGQWQIGQAGRTSRLVFGAIWVHIALWVATTAFNAQTGLTLVGQKVPGAELFKRQQRTPLHQLPAEMKAARDFLVSELGRRGLDTEDGDAMRAAALLAGDHPDAPRIRFRDLSTWAQRKLAGLPWYYSPAEFERDRSERCAVFWGCLLLAAMLLIRWPGLHHVLTKGFLRKAVFGIRVAAPTGLTIACLIGGSPQPDVIALITGLVLVAVGVLVLAYWLGWLVSRDLGPTRHYAPFMAIRLLQKRRIAFFAIGAVTLCVAMVLIVVSVMGGFLDLIRERSRGLLGDLIMENASLQGFAGYDEYIRRVKQLRDTKGRPIIAEATPVIYTYGVLRFPVSYVTKPVRVVGIRLRECIDVTRFGEGLSYNKYYPATTSLDRQQQPCWGRDSNKLPVLPAELEAARAKGLAAITDPDERHEFDRYPEGEYPGPGTYADFTESDASFVYHGLNDIAAELRILGEDAAEGRWGPASRPASAETGGVSTSPSPPGLAERGQKLAARLEELVERLPGDADVKPLDASLREVIGQFMTLTDLLRAHDAKVGQTINDILKRLQPVTDKLAEIRLRPGYSGKQIYGVIIGRDLIAERQSSGRYLRYDFYARGMEMLVTVLPLTTKGTFTRQQPISLPLRYVDDSWTRVYDIDNMCVYVDFEMLQKTMEMGRNRLEDGSGFTSPRASQVLIKLTPGQDILACRERLMNEWSDFCLTWPHTRDQHWMSYVKVRTWEEQQAQFIAAVENEKILVTTLFAVISAVAIFLILCIFYMIVSEKTRDIGTLKSVGAAAGGVAGVFLAYGAAIGVVGASLGIWLGSMFVHRINTIQDWIARIHPNLRVWNPEVYSFDVIPDRVNFEEAATIFVVAIIASVLGATFPALRAGRTWPVEALRYE